MSADDPLEGFPEDLNSHKTIRQVLHWTAKETIRGDLSPQRAAEVRKLTEMAAKSLAMEQAADLAREIKQHAPQAGDIPPAPSQKRTAPSLITMNMFSMEPPREPKQRVYATSEAPVIIDAPVQAHTARISGSKQALESAKRGFLDIPDPQDDPEEDDR
jgi:hypothetical protein